MGDLFERLEQEAKLKYNHFLENYPPAYYALYKKYVSEKEIQLYLSLVNLTNYFERAGILGDPDETALKILALSIDETTESLSEKLESIQFRLSKAGKDLEDCAN